MFMIDMSVPCGHRSADALREVARFAFPCAAGHRRYMVMRNGGPFRHTPRPHLMIADGGVSPDG